MLTDSVSLVKDLVRYECILDTCLYLLKYKSKIEKTKLWMELPHFCGLIQLCSTRLQKFFFHDDFGIAGPYLTVKAIGKKIEIRVKLTYDIKILTTWKSHQEGQKTRAAKYIECNM